MLSTDIEQRNPLGKVIVMGDFNARTGSVSDLVANKRCRHVPSLPQCFKGNEEIANRKSEDKGKVCTYGNCLT